jgi:hypothetical protein
MTIAGIAGFLFGGLVGLLIRPVFDSYLSWRHIKAARDEVPAYPFLHESYEEHESWPI